MASRFGVDFIETSAFTGENIIPAFEKIGAAILQDLDGKDKSQIPLTVPKKSTLIRIKVLQVVSSNLHLPDFWNLSYSQIYQKKKQIEWIFEGENMLFE